MNKGVLYLVPCTLGNDDTELTIPQGVKNTIAGIEYFIAENEKSARHFLKTLNAGIVQQQLNISVISKHDAGADYTSLLQPLLIGKNIGLLSEAGLPAVADPGAAIVHLAHKKNIRVVPLTGPSSIFMALMASGLNGQQFAFHGYLPIDKEEKKSALRQLEKESFQKKQTQIFIETPYRNMQLLQEIMLACEPSTFLCIATDISLPSEAVLTKAVSEWQKSVPDIHKRPAVFLLLKK